MEKKYFADLHCHPHSRAFHWMRHTRHERKKKKYNPWTVALSNFKKQKAGKRAFSYSQCDPVKLWNSNTRLVFASLYPFEKGFYTGSDNIDKTKLADLLGKAAGVGLTLLMPWKLVFAAIKKAVHGFSGGENSLRDYFQATLMRMPLKRINYFVSPEYDYYEELIRERDFLTSKSGVTSRNEIINAGFFKFLKSKKKQRRKHPESLEATGQYVVCKNFGEVKQTIDDENIAFVMTIEGMHSLGYDPKKMDRSQLIDRINALKNWEYPVFFVTFAHHFQNYLCGHAHSLIKSTSWFMTQQADLNAGFVNDGEVAVRHLLSLDQQLNHDPSLGRRIHIDLKHTAAKSRKWFYREIIDKLPAGVEPIPVIMSHCGYADQPDLDSLIANQDNENDDDLSPNGFYPWNINACDEDIQYAAKTGGLIGLTLDQRILGGGTKHKTGKDADLAWRNLKAMVDVIKAMPSHKDRMWQTVTIGTDFEGYVDPVNRYADALDFKLLRQDLIDNIKTDIWNKSLGADYLLNSEADIEQVVDDFCFGNAWRFLERNFT
ncbi:MAG: hypothetical protein RJQ09_14585 [Cyclobacteriaceae bacterium]